MINRKIQPLIHPVGQVDYIRAQQVELTNGLPVYWINAGSQDVIKIDFIFNAGSWQQPANLIASICNSMLEEGSRSYTASQIAERFDYYGAYFQLQTEQDYGRVGVITLTKYLPQILEILEDIIKYPTFPEHELDVMISKNKQKFLVENEKVKTLCQKKFTSVLYGENHPYAMTNKIEDYSTVSRDLLSRFHKDFYHSGNCRLILAGKVDEKAIDLFERHFGGNDWNGNHYETEQFKIRSNSEKYHFIDKANAMQSAFRIGRRWVSKNHDDYIGLSILVTILGGYFGSRLMTNIREDKGYTYGIGSFVISLKEDDYLVIATEVGNEYVKATEKEIIYEMNRLCNEPVPDKELGTVRSFLIGEFLRDFDGPFALASSFKAINDFNLDYSFYDRYLHTIKTITPNKLIELANKYLSYDDFYLVVAGSTKNML